MIIGLVSYCPAREAQTLHLCVFLDENSSVISHKAIENRFCKTLELLYDLKTVKKQFFVSVFIFLHFIVESIKLISL